MPAPGGKTTHFTSYLVAEEGGLVEALDLHENKLRKNSSKRKTPWVEETEFILMHSMLEK